MFASHQLNTRFLYCAVQGGDIYAVATPVACGSSPWAAAPIRVCLPVDTQRYITHSRTTPRFSEYAIMALLWHGLYGLCFWADIFLLLGRFFFAFHRLSMWLARFVCSRYPHRTPSSHVDPVAQLNPLYQTRWKNFRELTRGSVMCSFFSVYCGARHYSSSCSVTTCDGFLPCHKKYMFKRLLAVRPLTLALSGVRATVSHHHAAAGRARPLFWYGGGSGGLRDCVSSRLMKEKPTIYFLFSRYKRGIVAAKQVIVMIL